MALTRLASLRPDQSILGVAALAVVLAVPMITAHAATPASDGSPLAGAGKPAVVPAPVTMTRGYGTFTLSPDSRIVAEGAPATEVGNALAARLRPATGYPLPVVTGDPRDGDLALRLGDPGTPGDEGYQLDVTATGASLVAETAHGLFNGVQTIRQLLPGWIESPTARPGPWSMPVVHIVDYPRYSYRGVMLDIARHYEPPAAVKRLIDQVSAYKINVLHLHVSDDQGFRIVIDGFPNLTELGGQGSVGTHGREMDPGGFWTQAEYRDVVAYAAAHFITVVPEVDSPGHNNAIIMSEYGDTANPLLNGHPQDINCGRNEPPVWNYTGEVGYSAMCPDSDNTWTILGAIIEQLTAMSPGPYYHLGGDEVPASLMSHEVYAALVNRESELVAGHGRTVMGWAEISGKGTTPPAGSIAQYWSPASGSDEGTFTATDAVAKGMKLVMSPATHAYLDQKYLAGDAGEVPPTIGLSWACSEGCDIDQFFGWDPGGYVDGVTDDDVIGVEGATWAETLVTFDEVDYLVFPRLLALAEVGWSPRADRSPTGPVYAGFVSRLAAQGVRFSVADTNFYPTPMAPWRLDQRAADAAVGDDGTVTGALAALSAPGRPASAITTTVDWGDGTTSAGTVTGDPATDTSVNGLYTVTGEHTYSEPGTYTVQVTSSADGTATVTTKVTLHWQV